MYRSLKNVLYNPSVLKNSSKSLKKVIKNEVIKNEVIKNEVIMDRPTW